MNNKQINNFYIKFTNFFGNNYPSVHEPIFFKNEKNTYKDASKQLLFLQLVSTLIFLKKRFRHIQNQNTL